MEEVLLDGLSDRGSIPLRSTTCAKDAEGILSAYADACERSSPFDASAQLPVLRRDPTKLGGCLSAYADAGERSSH